MSGRGVAARPPLDLPEGDSHQGQVQPLAELDVLIVDCQTTGASPAFGAVLELAWGVVRADQEELRELESHFIALPDGHSVPQQVIRLTGYDPARSASAISDAEAWRRMRRAVHDAAPVPTAIHYARFELSFLREWAARLQPDAEFPLDAVCVHAVARRLFPTLPRQSLRALAGFLGHSLDLTRSSRGHVEATAFVWRKLCGELAARGIETWPRLRAWLLEPAAAPARTKKPSYPLAKSRYKTLPNEPGVYRFLRSNGDVLYVGKATSLSKRTASHFSARAGTQQAPEMLTQVSDIQVTVVASALEAALLEHETIRALRPPYNVQLTTSDARVWYSTRSFDAACPAPDERHSLGPLPSEYSLRALGAQASLVSGSPPSQRLRAEAVGVSGLWTPDEPVFAAGFALYAKRHELESGTREARRRVLDAAKLLLRARALGKVEDDTLIGEVSEEAKSRQWDPERVARHLERAAAQAYQVYRRARWLRLLSDCEIIYREPESSRTRRLQLQNGELREASDAAPNFAPSAHPGRAPATPSACVFDRTIYDRLRILSTELKRVQRDGGSLQIYVGRARRAIPAARLAGIQRVV